MKRSTERILTTHTGSLPKPEAVVRQLERRDREGLNGDAEAFRREVKDAVADVVRRQIDAGVDVVNDGETGKVSYATYVKERLTGFDGEGGPPRSPEFEEYSDFFARTIGGGLGVELPACNGPVEHRGLEGIHEDIANLKAALNGGECADAFLGAPSPGTIALHLQNAHYASDEEYAFALADAMKPEYDAVHEAGLLLQIDCPDLAMGRHLPHAELGIDEFRRRSEINVEALNHAVRDIPADSMRMHLCWGNYEGPHVYDVALGDIVDTVYKAKPAAISFESANPRHAHEWRVFEERKLPDEKLLMPGVLDSTTNFVEHPELVAERLVRLAGIVGRERVIAGTDCGFATFTTFNWVDPKIVWTKLQAMADGARLASDALW